MSSSLVVGIICLFVALISGLKATNNKEGKQWQKGIAITFLVLGIILIVFSLI